MKYKDLYKKIQATVKALEFSRDESELIWRVLKVLVQEYGKDLGIVSGRLYVQDGTMYRLINQIGESQDLTGFEIPAEYLPIRKLRESKYIIMHKNDRGLDPNLEEFLVIDTFAAIALGTEDQYLVSFSVIEPVNETHLHYSLNTIRFSTNFKLRELTLQHEFEKAYEIQSSLLPSVAPDRDGFDIYGKSIPADLVGGDAYDYIPIGDSTLGIGVLDAVGHGLPAALQARDVITGLRMGMAGDLKIESMMYRLNQVIHRSNLASRFASLFYCELEMYGNIVYINAGHPPPFLVSDDNIHELCRGGMVLGPNPLAVYKRGFAYLGTGDLLVIFSDGIIEARSSENIEFGTDRLRSIVLEKRSGSSKDIVETVFDAVSHHSNHQSPQDDQTLLIVKRTGEEDSRF